MGFLLKIKQTGSVIAISSMYERIAVTVCFQTPSITVFK